MKTAYIIQPGKLGDLIVSSPIAHYYSSLGYNIEWFVFDVFTNFLKRIPNISVKNLNTTLSTEQYFGNKRFDFSDNQAKTSSIILFDKIREYILLNKKENDIVLDICWGFPGSNQKNNQLIGSFHSQKRNWIDMRYFLGNVPLMERWKFTWIRDEKKEDELLKFIKQYANKKYGTENFSIVHNYKNNLKQKPLKNEINFAYIPGYEICDWYKVLLESDELACVDSSLCNFVEILPELKNKKKYYLGSEEPHYFEYMRNILINEWHDIYNKPIVSDYCDKL